MNLLTEKSIFRSLSSFLSDQWLNLTSKTNGGNGDAFANESLDHLSTLSSLFSEPVSMSTGLTSTSPISNDILNYYTEIIVKKNNANKCCTPCKPPDCEQDARARKRSNSIQKSVSESEEYDDSVTTEDEYLEKLYKTIPENVQGYRSQPPEKEFESSYRPKQTRISYSPCQMTPQDEYKCPFYRQRQNQTSSYRLPQNESKCPFYRQQQKNQKSPQNDARYPYRQQQKEQSSPSQRKTQNASKRCFSIQNDLASSSQRMPQDQYESPFSMQEQRQTENKFEYPSQTQQQNDEFPCQKQPQNGQQQRDQTSPYQNEVEYPFNTPLQNDQASSYQKQPFYAQPQEDYTLSSSSLSQMQVPPSMSSLTQFPRDVTQSVGCQSHRSKSEILQNPDAPRRVGDKSPKYQFPPCSLFGREASRVRFDSKGEIAGPCQKANRVLTFAADTETEPTCTSTRYQQARCNQPEPVCTSNSVPRPRRSSSVILKEPSQLISEVESGNIILPSNANTDKNKRLCLPKEFPTIVKDKRVTEFFDFTTTCTRDEDNCTCVPIKNKMAAVKKGIVVADGPVCVRQKDSTPTRKLCFPKKFKQFFKRDKKRPFEVSTCSCGQECTCKLQPTMNAVKQGYIKPGEAMCVQKQEVTEKSWIREPEKKKQETAQTSTVLMSDTNVQVAPICPETRSIQTNVRSCCVEKRTQTFGTATVDNFAQAQFRDPSRSLNAANEDYFVRGDMPASKYNMPTPCDLPNPYCCMPTPKCCTTTQTCGIPTPKCDVVTSTCGCGCMTRNTFVLPPRPSKEGSDEKMGSLKSLIVKQAKDTDENFKNVFTELKIQKEDIKELNQMYQDLSNKIGRQEKSFSKLLKTIFKDSKQMLIRNGTKEELPEKEYVAKEQNGSDYTARRVQPTQTSQLQRRDSNKSVSTESKSKNSISSGCLGDSTNKVSQNSKGSTNSPQKNSKGTITDPLLVQEKEVRTTDPVNASIGKSTDVKHVTDLSRASQSKDDIIQNPTTTTEEEIKVSEPTLDNNIKPTISEPKRANIPKPPISEPKRNNNPNQPMSEHKRHNTEQPIPERKKNNTNPNSPRNEKNDTKTIAVSTNDGAKTVKTASVNTDKSKKNVTVDTDDHRKSMCTDPYSQKPADLCLCKLLSKSKSAKLSDRDSYNSEKDKKNSVNCRKRSYLSGSSTSQDISITVKNDSNNEVFTIYKNPEPCKSVKISDDTRDPPSACYEDKSDSWTSNILRWIRSSFENLECRERFNKCKTKTRETFFERKFCKIEESTLSLCIVRERP